MPQHTQHQLRELGIPEGGGSGAEDAGAGAQEDRVVRHPRLLPAGDETRFEVALDALRTAVLAELVTLLPAAWRQYKTRLAAHAVLGGRWRGSSGRTAAASGPRCCAAWMCRRRMSVVPAGGAV